VTVVTALSVTLRLGLAALFIYAGVAKLLDTQSFAVDLANYQLLPAALVPLVAVTLPGIETASGACLLISRTARAASFLAFLMCLAFTVAVGQALARGINLDCGCFGTTSAPVTTSTLVRDLGLLGAAGMVLLALRPR
jgi:putative oxidoreductase